MLVTKIAFLRQLRRILASGHHLDSAEGTGNGTVFTADTLRRLKLDAVVGETERLGRAGGHAGRIVAVTAGGHAADAAVRNQVDAREKIMPPLRPAVLVVGDSAGHFASVAADAARSVGNNKSVHWLPLLLFRN